MNNFKGRDYTELIEPLGLMQKENASEEDEATTFEQMEQKILYYSAALTFGLEPQLIAEAKSFTVVAKEFCKKVSEGNGVRSSALAAQLFAIEDDSIFLLLLGRSFGYLWW